MKHIEGNFKGVRNIYIYYQAWLPEGKGKAVLLVVHGLGEHSGRYMNVVNPFVPRGYAVYGFDLIGHGKSGGAREMVERFEDYTDTLTTYYNRIRGWQAGKPIFLLGHSMGGLIAAYYLIDHQADFQGAVISAPAVKISASISPVTIWMGNVLAVLAPTLGVLPVDAGAISRDPEVVKAYVNDPLVFHSKTPARLAAELYKAMLRVSAEADKITLPFIALQGGDDKIVDPGAAQMLYDRAGSKDKTIKVYPGLYHEVFNAPAPERAPVLKDVENWLAAHV
jgi:alpha-beta hydrolase superfamily lysophospholipase